MAMYERESIQRFLENILEKFGYYNVAPLPDQLNNNNNIPNDIPNDIPDIEQYENQPFRLFESYPRYGNIKNLLFNDATKRFDRISRNGMSYKSFLGDHVDGAISGVRKCPVTKLTLCVTSVPEMQKCGKMSLALGTFKMSIITIFGHKDFMQYFVTKFDIFHENISIAFNTGSYLELNS